MYLGDTMNLKQILGKNVKYYRIQKHYTQEKLASIVNSSPKYISRIELGQHNPSLEMIGKLATALDIEPEKLFSKTIVLPDRVSILTKL